MKLVIQKVKESSVTINQEVVGEIGEGLMVLVCFTNGDNQQIIDKMINKLIHLRIFIDENEKMNLSLLDVKGSILSISQFTLYADCKKGRRPSFIDAARPETASPLYDYFNEALVAQGIKVEKGVFGADMKVSLINDGPITIVLDSQELF